MPSIRAPLLMKYTTKSAMFNETLTKAIKAISLPPSPPVHATSTGPGPGADGAFGGGISAAAPQAAEPSEEPEQPREPMGPYDAKSCLDELDDGHANRLPRGVAAFSVVISR